MSSQLQKFTQIIATLRGPNGCPWDKEQSHQSLLPCILEEAYEYFEAVQSGDAHKMKEELGDLLLQVGLQAQIAKDNGEFDIEAVAETISQKLIRRHPHVFGNVEVASSEEVSANWDEIKKTEKAHHDRVSALDGVPRALPALFRAEKIQRRAAKVGFDWDDPGPVFNKVEEEFREFRHEIERNEPEKAEEELGDILFALVNVARHRGIHAETALNRTIDKFSRRFRYVEQSFVNRGRSIEDATLEEMDRYWEESKKITG